MIRILATFLVFGLVNSFAYAKTEMSLFVSNHLGFRKQETLVVENPRTIYFNGVQVPKKLLPKIEKSLLTLGKIPDEKKKFCYGNRYNYTLIKDANKKEVQACAEGKEFARIAMAFSDIQKVMLGNK